MRTHDPATGRSSVTRVRAGRAAPRRRAPLAVAVAAFAVVIGCAPTPAPAPAPAAQATEAQVTVVHGLRGELVDVYLDGKLLLDGFKPDRLTDPMAVPIGSHTIDLRPAGTPSADPPKATATATLEPGPVAVVAHFTPDGGWTMSMFANDVEPLAAGTGRVVFRNAAAVTPVAVTLEGAAALPPIDAGKEAAENVPAASYAVKVGASDGATLLPDDDIAVDAGAALVLYLVGQGDNVTWLSQRIAASAAAPAAVQAGNSGLLARESTGMALIGVGSMSIGAAVILMLGRDRRRRVIPVR